MKKPLVGVFDVLVQSHDVHGEILVPHAFAYFCALLAVIPKKIF